MSYYGFMTYKRLPNGHWPTPACFDPKPPRTWHEKLKCDAQKSTPDTILLDEEFMHVHLGLVQYTEACAMMQKLAGDKYRLQVEVGGDMIKVSYHKLIRKDNRGEWTIRMCHSNPSWDFKKLHFNGFC